MSRQQRDCPAPGAGRQRGRLATGQPCAVAGQEGRHVVSERACGEQQRGVRGGDTGVVAPIAGAHTGALVVSKQRSFWQEALHSRRPGRRRGTHPGRAHCRAPGRPRVAWRQLRGSNAAWAGSYEEWPGQQPTLAASVPPWMCDADSQRAHLTRMLTTPCARRSGGGVGGGIFDATEISSSRFRRRARCAPHGRRVEQRRRRVGSRLVVLVWPEGACVAVPSAGHKFRGTGPHARPLPSLSRLLAAWRQGQGHEGAPG